MSFVSFMQWAGEQSSAQLRQTLQLQHAARLALTQRLDTLGQARDRQACRQSIGGCALRIGYIEGLLAARQQATERAQLTLFE